MQVLIGSKRYYDKHLVLVNESNPLSNLANFYKIVNISDKKFKNLGEEKIRKASDMPFIKFNL